MILEAFAKHLHTADPDLPATCILAGWLFEKLSVSPESKVDKVLHCEIAIASRSSGGNTVELKTAKPGQSHVFKGLSGSGKKLLNSLNQYALSYEQQKWSRWVHKVKASDFAGRSG